jgi:hypothetical protein
VLWRPVKGIATLPIFDPTPSYNLVSPFMSYQPTPDLVAAFSIEKLLNQHCEKYMCVQ